MIILQGNIYGFLLTKQLSILGSNQIKTHPPVIKRTHFPLMLAWACTVDKVEGLSFNKVIVSFQLLKQQNFFYGQIYIDLSRVASL